MTRKRTIILSLALAATCLAARAAQAPPLKVTCTFSNPAFAGSCVITTTRKEKQKPAAACKPLLDCLNNPLCGRGDCQATSIRQGWKLVSAK